jgi:two-component sensor histidine kinase
VTNFGAVRDPDTGLFDWARLVHADDLRETRARWTAAAETMEEFACEHRLLMADGTWRWHLSRAFPVSEGSRRADATWYGTATDIHELKLLQEHRLLLSQELDHRMKNALTLVQSIANQTFRAMGGDMEAVRAFNARLRALAEANDILVHGDWTEVDVGEICRRTLAPLGIEDRVEMAGGALSVPPRMGFLLSLGLHELATNAMKHGSLTVPGGRVRLAWEGRIPRDGRFRVTWEEHGGPTVGTPETEGFGSRLLKQALAAEIAGEVEIAFAEAGVRCRIEGRAG